MALPSADCQFIAAISDALGVELTIWTAGGHSFTGKVLTYTTTAPGHLVLLLRRGTQVKVLYADIVTAAT